MQKIIILATQRTGSSDLLDSLEKNPLAYEPFNSITTRAEFRDVLQAAQVINRLHNPLGYIDFLFERVNCIKICCEHLHEGNLKSICQSAYNKIILDRDRRNQYESYLRANKYNSWAKTANLETPKFIEQEFIDYCQRINKIYNELYNARNIIYVRKI